MAEPEDGRQPLTDDEWCTLGERGEKARPDLYERTFTVECHPDWYDGPCLCRECASYCDDRPDEAV